MTTHQDPLTIRTTALLAMVFDDREKRSAEVTRPSSLAEAGPLRLTPRVWEWLSCAVGKSKSGWGDSPSCCTYGRRWYDAEGMSSGIAEGERRRDISVPAAYSVKHGLGGLARARV